MAKSEAGWNAGVLFWLALTGDEEEDAGSEGLVKAVKGRIVDEGHDANDDADEARQQGQDHESPRGIPVCCRTKGCKQAQSKRCNLSLSPRASFTGKQTSMAHFKAESIT